MIWPTVLRGLSEVYGFWKMYCTRLQHVLAALPGPRASGRAPER